MNENPIKERKPVDSANFSPSMDNNSYKTTIVIHSILKKCIINETCKDQVSKRLHTNLLTINRADCKVLPKLKK